MDVAFLIPFFGIIPLELIETFPFSQYVFSAVLTESLLSKLELEIDNFLENFRYQEVDLCLLDTWENSRILTESIRNILKGRGIPFDEKNFREL